MAPRTQQQKAADFRALHDGEAFVIPNPWDAGSARILAALGFQALASTSGGFAMTLGRLDGAVTLDEVADHTRVLDQATDLPVSVDLENGYGPAPEDAARAITSAARAGAVGGSIEDYDPQDGIYPIDHAAERVAAASEAAKRLDFPFTLTARAENHFRGTPIWTTRSHGCRPTSAPARTCCTRLGSQTSSRSERCARRCRSPSTCWRVLTSR